MKIYDVDPVVPYKATHINPQETKAEIDGLLARWGIRQVYWDWQPENGKVDLIFKVPETFGGTQPSVKLSPPIIWAKCNRKRREEINWSVSMRCLYWSLKATLEWIYLAQFDKTTGFLPFLVASDGKTQLKDIILPRLGHVSELAALPSNDEEKRNLAKVITIEGKKEVGS